MDIMYVVGKGFRIRISARCIASLVVLMTYFA